MSSTNIVKWNYEIYQWNDVFPKDRMPECIQKCNTYLQSNPSAVLNAICQSVLFPTSNTAVYRFGSKAATKPAIGNYNFQTSGFIYSGYVKKVARPSGPPLCTFQ
jgi:hypothetical protein